MKKQFAFICFAVTLSLSAQVKKEIKDQIVEASCGQCQFKMNDKKGCDLAVRIEGKSYFVEGTSIDKHGDAHAQDGFCSTIRKAKVSGIISDKTFIATSFVVIPSKKKIEVK